MRVDEVWAQRANEFARQNAHQSCTDHEVWLIPLNLGEKCGTPGYAIGKRTGFHNKCGYVEFSGVSETRSVVISTDRNDFRAEIASLFSFEQCSEVASPSGDQNNNA